MLITFKTQEARLAHPQASLFSQGDWGRYFTLGIDGHLVDMMCQPTVGQAIQLLNLHLTEYTAATKNEWICAIVCLRVRFPDTNPDDFFRIMVAYMTCTLADCFLAFCGAGIQLSESIFQEIIPIMNLGSGGSRIFLRSCFLEACEQGQAAIGQWVYSLETSPEHRAEMLRADKYAAFCCACEGAYVAMVQWLYSLETSTELQAAMLQSIWERDHLETMRWLYKILTPDQRAAMPEVGNYAAFHRACQTGSLETARWLYKVATSEQRAVMLQARYDDGNYRPFRNACSDGHLEIARWLYKVATSEQRAVMLRARYDDGNYGPFHEACADGHFDIARWLYKVATPQQRAVMLEDSDYCVFGDACAGGHLETARWLYELASPEGRSNMLPSSDWQGNYQAFRGACAAGHLDTARWLYGLATTAEQQTQMLRPKDYRGDYAPLRLACEGGHFETARWLYELLTPQQRAVMLQTRDSYALPYVAFHLACAGGHLAMAQWLYSLVTTAEQKSLMLLLDCDSNRAVYAPFRTACAGGHLDTARWVYSLATTREQREAMFQLSYDGRPKNVFCLACEGGHLGTAQWLYEVATFRQRAAMLHHRLSAVRVRDYQLDLDYAAFLRASAGDRLDIARWFCSLAGTVLYELSDANVLHGDYQAFRLACKGGHLEIARWLYSLATTPQQQTQMLMPRHHTFEMACAGGHLDTARWLYSQATIAEQQASVDSDSGRRAFRAACHGGHLDTARWLLATIAEQHVYVDSTAFSFACQAGSLDTARWLYELKTPEQGARMLDYYHNFVGACGAGSLETACWIYELADPVQRRRIMDYERICFAIRCACEAGSLEIARWLYGLVAPVQRSRILQETDNNGNYSVFLGACRSGSLDTARWVYQLADREHRERMLRANNYHAFSDACARGDFETARWVYSLLPNRLGNLDRSQMLGARNSELFCRACRVGSLETVRWLYSLDESVLHTMSRRACGRYPLFCEELRLCDIEIINFLLPLSPYLLACLEPHDDGEYGERIVYPFVGNFIETLHQRQEAHQIADPDSVFNLEDEQETLFAFYCLRNLIRRHDPALMDHINYLLMLPRLRLILHHEVNDAGENECLRLALRIGNREAAAALMQIETVRTHALAHNCYEEEQRVHGGFSLAEIARDRESSMRVLNAAEKAIIERVKTHYAVAVEAQGGVIAVFEAFKRDLRGQYVVAPACQIVKGNNIPLPFEYADFQVYRESNLLTPKQVRSAYQAYYQHPVHSAYRYLSKPNYWMHEDAGYVNMNEARTQRWSTFEEYVSTIAYFWMAAKDAQMPAIDGHTLEGRMVLFIKELALIGRAHNWDKTRVVKNALGEPTDKVEQYDDLEGDRPSCFSGVNRRLFQSVLGHPFFMGLTREVLEIEFVHCVQEKVTQVLAGQSGDGDVAKNAQRVCAELTAFCELGFIEGQPPSALLLSFNFSEEDIRVFKVQLSEKWGVNLARDLALNTSIDETLRMNPNDALIVHFATRANLFGMLNGMIRTAVSRGTQRHGFFARADGALSAVTDQQGTAAMEIFEHATERPN